MTCEMGSSLLAYGGVSVFQGEAVGANLHHL